MRDGRRRWKLIGLIIVLGVTSIIGLTLINRPKAAVYSEPINSQWLIDEVSTMHDGGVLPHHPGGWPWADKSNPHVDDDRERQFGPINLPGGHDLIITWAYLVPEEGMSSNLNAAVEITEIGVAFLSKSTNKWTRIDSPNDISWGGLATSWSSYAGNSFAGDFNGQDGPGGGKVTGVGFGAWQDPSWHLHFTGEHEPIPNSSDVAETVSWVKARLVLRNQNGTDDRAQAHYLLGVGTDYKTAPNMACPCPSSAIGKHKYVTNEWRTFVASTLSPDTVRRLEAENNLPPIPGMGEAGPTTQPTSQPTAAPTQAPDPAAAPFDLDDSGDIGVGDLSLLIADYPRQGQNPSPNSPADFNTNGAVDVADLSKLIVNWGKRVR